jgi:hypothetical protein
VHHERIDFGRLNEELQADVLYRVLDDAAAGEVIIPPHPDDRMPDAACVASNAETVRQRFGLAGYGTRLMEVYRALLDAPASGSAEALPPAALIHRFLAPERINLLRT